MINSLDYKKSGGGIIERENKEGEKMENKKKQRYKMMIKALGIMIVSILVLGISYAVFKTKSVGEKKNKIATGSFNVEMKNEQEIELNNEAPKREKKAKEEAPFTFVIENTGTIEALYNIYIETEEETTLSSEVIRYYVTKTNQEGKETIVTKTSQILEETKIKDNTYKIEIGRIKKEEVYNYKLYLWVDIDASIEEASNKVFSGRIKLEAEQYMGNSNIVKALEYQEDKEAANYCIIGEEETCEESMCYLNKEKGSCKAGTIIIYNVNDKARKYFYVLHDDKEKMTLQQRENTVNKVAWSLEKDENGNPTNTKGPTEALSKLEEATKTWNNVEDQTYTLGETIFLEGTNAYTGCNSITLVCDKNQYTMPKRTAKARMVTVQEAIKVGCRTNQKSCPMYMYTCLNNSISCSGQSTYSYLLMQAWTTNTKQPFTIWFLGYIRNSTYNSNMVDASNFTSARAVVTIKK